MIVLKSLKKITVEVSIGGVCQKFFGLSFLDSSTFADLQQFQVISMLGQEPPTVKMSCKFVK